MTALLTMAPVFARGTVRTDSAARLASTPMGTATAIKVDGELSDEVWRTAPPVTEFVQREPKEGAEPSFKTEVRVAHDGTNVYVAVTAIDPEPARVKGHLTRRDERSPSDWIRVIIDSYLDRRTAYEFAVNPVGVKQDSYWFNDGNNDTSWDAVWDVEVNRTATGWDAEFRIPFSQLRFDPNRGGDFGFAVVREIARLNEIDTWPLIARSANGYVSNFGVLTGIRTTGSPKRLEIVPYAVSQVRTESEGRTNPLVQNVDPGAAVGLDVKYAMTPGLTLTATVNPDFGQVEADPAVVNLSAFETFFSERRPFFIEGSGTFRFDVDCNDGQCTGLFYSRRIGRSPHGSPDTPEEGYSASPTESTILGAAKVTGRMGGFSVGALHAVTGEETATIASPSRRYGQVVEPLTNYSVVRARREFADQSSLGFMTTATNRRLTDAVDFLADQAYTGGVDWDWRLKRMYSLSGFWAGSTILGSADAIARLQANSTHYFQRPDAAHVELDPTRTSLNGHAGLLSFSKIAGEKVRFNSNVNFKSPGFDMNDLGFMRRADQTSMGNWLQYRDMKPGKILRSWVINFNQWAGWNFAGDNLYAGTNVNMHFTFTSNYRTGFGVNMNKSELDDRLTRGGPAGLRNSSWNVWGYVDGDSRKPVTTGSFQHYWSDRHGSRSMGVNPWLTLRPRSSLMLQGGVGINRNADEFQWVRRVDVAGAPRYIFGALDQTTVNFNFRVNYTVTPTLSIQLYAQPFVSAGDYASFRELIDGRAPRYADRFAPFAYDDDPDFNYRSFRTTNVLRWEYRPGSTLFVVWQQGREATIGRGDFRFGRDFGNVFSTPARNVFLVKLAHWLNF